MYQRAENKGLDPSWLDFAFFNFWGRPDFPFKGPKTLENMKLGRVLLLHCATKIEGKVWQTNPPGSCLNLPQPLDWDSSVLKTENLSKK